MTKLERARQFIIVELGDGKEHSRKELIHKAIQNGVMRDERDMCLTNALAYLRKNEMRFCTMSAGKYLWRNNENGPIEVDFQDDSEEFNYFIKRMRQYATNISRLELNWKTSDLGEIEEARRKRKELLDLSRFISEQIRE